MLVRSGMLPTLIGGRPSCAAGLNRYREADSLSIVKVGLCGHGYWGQNLLRTFSSDPRFEVVAVSDIRESARERVRRTSATIRLYDDGTEVIDDPEVEAVAIATPAATHFSLARRALLRDKHVLVEKPLCARVAEARELVAVADHNGATLMVDHTYLFHGAVGKLRQLHQNGSLGAVSYYDFAQGQSRPLPARPQRDYGI